MQPAIAALLGRVQGFIATWFKRNPPPTHIPLPAPSRVSRTSEEDMWHAYEATLPPEPAPPSPIAPPPRMNRHHRRLYEKARRKYDKFVEPEGPEPIKTEHAEPPPRQPRQAQPDEEKYNGLVIDDRDELIVDEWLEGEGDLVLYEKSEFWGEFNFRDTILDQLDRYWVYLARMRKHDPDAYQFYKRVGAVLVPYAASSTFSDKPHEIKPIADLEKYKRGIKLTPWFKEHWPTFGCCAFTNPRDEKAEGIKLNGHYTTHPKFIYFSRVKNFPAEVQPVKGGKCYLLTVWWDREHGRHAFKWGRPQEFPIHISDDGQTIRVLKTRKQHQWWDWRIPHNYESWSKQYNLDPQTHLTHLFCTAVANIERAHYSMLRVEVSKGGMSAVFGIDPSRTSYFFQDRDIILTEGGVKKRIFHMVRPYVRSDGTPVKASFRGLREFTWAGYHVFISIPGRDHPHLIEIDVAGEWYEKGEDLKLRDGVRAKEFGKMLKERVHRARP